MQHTRWEQARGEAVARQAARERREAAQTAAREAAGNMSVLEATGGFLIALGRFLTLLVWGPIFLVRYPTPEGAGLSLAGHALTETIGSLT